MSRDKLTVALLTEVFFDAGGGERLRALLAEARRRGAGLAVLPELPLDPWSPATQVARDEDAEPPGGPRQRRLAAAARETGVALLGGAIVRDPAIGRRHNTALLYDAAGELLMAYRKTHLPEEEGYWETSHYEPGDDLPEVTGRLGMPLGVQICSDVNRPQLTHLLAARGAEAVFAPRATPVGTWPRWRRVLAANAATAAVYVVSVNRPRPEPGVDIGGPSVVVGPDGEVIAETVEPLALVTLDRRVVAAARQEYPGYLPVRADLYAEGWRRAAAASPGNPPRRSA